MESREYIIPLSLLFAHSDPIENQKIQGRKHTNGSPLITIEVWGEAHLYFKIRTFEHYSNVTGSIGVGRES